MTNFYQHISCPTRGPNTLDHCIYTQFKKAYKAHSLPAFGKSDHAAIFLTPEYKQRIVQEPPVEREETRRSFHSEATLQAALDDVDWDMSFFLTYIYIYALVLCYFYLIFIFLHCPLSRPDLIYILLLIIPCII